MSILKSIGAFLFLLVVCVLAYWDLATFQYSLKWDMLDCYFPWRFFVGESIQNRVFPLWNPYQHLGYPIYADMRSVFYPEAFIVGLLGGYNMQVLHFLFVFYITAAGTGLYKLASFFVKSEIIKITVASAYVMCGFFVGHGQEMFGIIAATWIPWVLYYFLRFQKGLAWADLWKLSFFLFLQLTGGYQALSLILFYLLITLFIVGFIRNARDYDAHPVLKIIGRNAALSGVILLSLSVLIVTYVQVAPNVDRLTGLSLQDAYTGLLTPQALLSLLAPFSVAEDAGFLGTNISMANVYVGLLILGFAVAGLFQKKRWAAWVITIFGIVCLLASLGPHTPLREFMYDYVPGMNLFRMSSFFSYFSQVAFLLLAAIAIQKLLDHPIDSLKQVRNGFGLVLLALVIITVSSWIDRPEEVSMILAQLKGLSEFTYHQRLVSHSILQIAIVLIFLGFLFGLRKKKTAVSFVILAFVLAEMFVAVQLNFEATVGDPFSPKTIQERLDNEPDGFPIPPLSIPLGDNVEAKPRLSPLFHNTNIYSKSIAWDGFNSFRLDRFEIFKRDHQQAYLEGLDHPLLFSTSEKSKIEIESFEPDRTQCNFYTDERCVLVFQQTFFTGWKVFVNGELQNQLLYNGIYPSVKLAPGDYSVVFEYENKPVILGFGISYVMFAIIIGVCIFFLIGSGNKSSTGRAIFLTSGIMILGVAFFGFKWSQLETMEEKRLNSFEALASKIGTISNANTQLLLHVDKPSLMDSLLVSKGVKGEVNYLHGLQCDDHSVLIEDLKSNQAKKIIYAGSNLREDRLVIELIRKVYPTKTSSRFGRDYVHVFENKGDRETIYTSSNGFETANPTWFYEEHQLDTLAPAASGNFGWSISTSQMGSPPIILRVGDITDETKLKLVFESKVLVPTGDRNSAGMFIQVERNGEQLWHRAREVNSCAISKNKWFETALIAEPDFDVQPDDVLKVFVWGTDKGDPIYLDDMSFSVYPQD